MWHYLTNMEFRVAGAETGYRQRSEGQSPCPTLGYSASVVHNFKQIKIQAWSKYKIELHVYLLDTDVSEMNRNRLKKTPLLRKYQIWPARTKG